MLEFYLCPRYAFSISESKVITVECANAGCISFPLALPQADNCHLWSITIIDSSGTPVYTNNCNVSHQVTTSRNLPPETKLDLVFDLSTKLMKVDKYRVEIQYRYTNDLQPILTSYIDVC